MATDTLATALAVLEMEFVCLGRPFGEDIGLARGPIAALVFFVIRPIMRRVMWVTFAAD